MVSSDPAQALGDFGALAEPWHARFGARDHLVQSDCWRRARY
jgi:hypothetical protein